jgi:uncharacterized membrane protein YccC
MWSGWGGAQISVVSSPTFGGNIVASLYRILGTVVAALWAIAVESAFPNNTAASLSFVMLFVLPATYLKLGTTYSKLGFQALSAIVSIQLAYMVNPLNPGIWNSIYEIAYKRALAIVVGVLVALATGRLVWPLLSRVELRRTLAKSVHVLAELYSVLQGSVEGALPTLQSSLPALKALESQAQAHILHAEALLQMATAEPRLKGPLPAVLYDRLLMHAQRALDQLTLLRTLMMRGAGFELNQDLKGRRSPLAAAAIEERREQTVNMQLYFYLLETSIESKRPLLYHLPDIARSVQRAFRKWRKVMVAHATEVAHAHAHAARASAAASSGSQTLLVPTARDRPRPSPPPAPADPSQDFGTVLVTAYAVALLDLSRTLELMGADTKDLFGVNAHLHYGSDFRRGLSTATDR